MIAFDHVTITYPGAQRPALDDATVRVGEGELCLVVGPTGAGKSTLLKAACGLVPHFTGGLLEGRVLVQGRDTRDHLPRDLADVVGVVVQDPAAGFVTDTVEEELAYVMEQLGLAPTVMRQRVEEAIDLLGLARLRNRALADLSSGEQQRVAIGAVMTAHPRILVLDEPTSALDPAAAEDVLAALTRLVHDLGMTVLLAEHRLERVVQYADRVISIAADGTVVEGIPAEVLATAAVAPPIVELARLAGWHPLPLSVRDARRRAGPLRDRLSRGSFSAPATGVRPDPDAGRPAPESASGSDGGRPADDDSSGTATRPVLGAPVLSAQDVHVRYGRTHAVRGADLTLRVGEVAALMGRNGAGKSSLLWALQGSGPRSAGRVLVAAAASDPIDRSSDPRREGPDRAHPADPAAMRPREARRHVALVPQNPQDLLYLDTVAAECAASDVQSGVRSGSTRALLDELTAAVPADTHPRDLSEGQRLALVLAIQLSARPRLLLLDEPTRGLDYAAKRHLATALARHAGSGGAVLLSSHDVEFVAECATRVLVMAEGEIVADGGARDVLVASPTFAPQVAKILHPLELLTVDAVRVALAATA